MHEEKRQNEQNDFFLEISSQKCFSYAVGNHLSLSFKENIISFGKVMFMNIPKQTKSLLTLSMVSLVNNIHMILEPYR